MFKIEADFRPIWSENLRNKLWPEIQTWKLFAQRSFKIKYLVNNISLEKQISKLSTQGSSESPRKEFYGIPTLRKKGEGDRKMLREVEGIMRVLNALEGKR